MLVSQNKRKGYNKNKNPNSTERYKMKKTRSFTILASPSHRSLFPQKLPVVSYGFFQEKKNVYKHGYIFLFF